VTGVALISSSPWRFRPEQSDLQAKLIVWIFAMRFPDGFHVRISYFINQFISEKKYGHRRSSTSRRADPANLDRVHAVHHDLVRHELAAHQRLKVAG